MFQPSVRPADAADDVIRLYGDTLYRLCLTLLGSEADAEDAVQETLLRYLQKAPAFADAAHQKAWLLKVAANQCRDMLRFRARHPQTPIDAWEGFAGDTADREILEALMTLPEKYRLVLVLYYVEDYRIDTIAQIIGRTPSAVKMRLQKGRRLLEAAYRKELD